MITLAIRTDQSEAELAIYENNNVIAEEKWSAHRELSDAILQRIDGILDSASKTHDDLTGIMVFAGPGSFTGLRIGITVGNTLASGLQIPIVSAGDPNWQKTALDKLNKEQDEKVVKPNYGAEPNITKPRK